MKKTTILLLVFSLFLTFAACTQSNEPDNTEQYKNTEQNENTSSENSDITESADVQSTTNSTEITTLLAEPVGGSEDDYFGVRKYKYRYNYYRITAHYIDIVGAEAYFEWFESNPDFAEKNLDEMLMVSYIKHFGITREQFDAASQMRKEFYEENGNTLLVYPFENNGVYSYDDEADEIYNADIIFTFDNDIINEYYARPPELIVENGTNALGETVE